MTAFWRMPGRFAPTAPSTGVNGGRIPSPTSMSRPLLRRVDSVFGRVTADTGSDGSSAVVTPSWGPLTVVWSGDSSCPGA
jgi:hypothetical protein